CARATRIGPPGASVPPEHALRALRSCRSACSRVRLVLIADVARRGAGTGRKSNEQAGKQREHPDQTGKGDVRPPRSEPPFMRYAVQCSPPIAVRGRQRLSQDLPVAAGSRATLDNYCRVTAQRFNVSLGRPPFGGYDKSAVRPFELC